MPIWIGGGYRVPILFSNKIKVQGLRKGKIKLSSFDTACIKIGFGGSKGISSNIKGYFILGDTGNIEFSGMAFWREGCSIRVDNGILKIGTGFWANKNCMISCSKGIEIDDGALLGWNVNIRDADGHDVSWYEKENKCSKVSIGRHVWLASYVTILKGVSIKDGCVIAYNSCVVKPILQTNALIAGYPARVVREDIIWE